MIDLNLERPFEHIKDFQSVFKTYFNPLCNFLYSRYIKDYDICRDIVQSTFMKIWEGREKIQVKTSVKSYIFQATKNRALDYIRDNSKHKDLELQDDFREYDKEDNNIDVDSHSFYVKQLILHAMEDLKPKTKEIFRLNKFEGLTYGEIAEHMKISKRTVETNMAKAFNMFKEIIKEKIDY